MSPRRNDIEIRKAAKAAFLALCAGLLPACGLGGSAETQASLPTPVENEETGDVTISGADDLGFVIVTADTDVVPQSATVVVDVETDETAALDFGAVLEALIPGARAQSSCLPSDVPQCDDLGADYVGREFRCTHHANADGSFTVRVPAGADAVISVSYLDENCLERSLAERREIPDDAYAINMEVNGLSVDWGNGTIFLLGLIEEGGTSGFGVDELRFDHARNELQAHVIYDMTEPDGLPTGLSLLTSAENTRYLALETTLETQIAKPVPVDSESGTLTNQQNLYLGNGTGATARTVAKLDFLAQDSLRCPGASADNRVLIFTRTEGLSNATAIEPALYVVKNFTDAAFDNAQLAADRFTINASSLSAAESLTIERFLMVQPVVNVGTHELIVLIRTDSTDRPYWLAKVDLASLACVNDATLPLVGTAVDAVTARRLGFDADDPVISVFRTDSTGLTLVLLDQSVQSAHIVTEAQLDGQTVDVFNADLAEYMPYDDGNLSRSFFLPDDTEIRHVAARARDDGSTAFSLYGVRGELGNLGIIDFDTANGSLNATSVEPGFSLRGFNPSEFAAGTFADGVPTFLIMADRGWAGDSFSNVIIRSEP